MKSKKGLSSLAIELCPEFGQSRDGDLVFGPGSVFQGIVHAHVPEKEASVHRLCVIFSASESVQLHSTLESVIRGRQHQLFGTQHVLWETTEEEKRPPRAQFRFTVQLPLIQLPPSMSHRSLRYACRYGVVAMLYDASKRVVASAQVPVHYRPWVVTRALKVPMHRHGRYALVRQPTTDYLPGDKVTLLLSPLLPKLQVSLELVQIVTLVCQMQDERVPPAETVLVRSVPRVLQQESHAPQQPHASHPIAIDIPWQLAPTYTHGRLIHIHYELVLKVGHPAAKWSVRTPQPEVIRLPMVLGTLGAGISLPDDIAHYSAFSGVFGDTLGTQLDRLEQRRLSSVPTMAATAAAAASNAAAAAAARAGGGQQANAEPNGATSSSTSSTSSTSASLPPRRSSTSSHSSATRRPSAAETPNNPRVMPVPKFLKTVEYENALPLYTPSTLPGYTLPPPPPAFAGSIHHNCIPTM
ncbi:hypothetical protein BC940DRAFT_330209 [Gongronella butleri]|nr:hypothetical protein BC940DRAFT_330209 [Gongronella butleri]